MGKGHMHKRKLFLLIFLIMFTPIMGCFKYAGDNNTNIRPDDKAIRAKGTVKFIEFEGGFYGIVADDGSKYKPVNLPKGFQKDGLRVKFEGNVNTDLLSIYMWGKLIRIIDIDEL